jgi:hypothetical protein
MIPMDPSRTSNNLGGASELFQSRGTPDQLLPKEEKLPMWAIGQKLKLIQSALPEKDDTKYETTNKRNVMTVAVSRYMSQTSRMVENTSSHFKHLVYVHQITTIEIDRFRQLLQSNNYLNQSIKHVMNQVGGMILTIDPSFKTQ